MRRVIKLGGSLLGWCAWPAAFRAWRAGQRPAQDLVVVGGGGRVEHLRQLDGRMGLGEVPCHWIAVRFMAVTAIQAARQAGWQAAWPQPGGGLELADVGPTVVDMEQALAAAALRRAAGWAPPADWQVTSDSLSAWLAWAVDADELVLLKSCDPPPAAAPAPSAGRGWPERPLSADARWGSWVAAGLVDSYFPRAVRPGMAVSAVNLRWWGLAERKGE